MTLKRTLIPLAIIIPLAAYSVVWALHKMDERRIVAAVTRYDLALAATTAKLDPAPLEGASTPDQISRVQTYLLFLYGNKKRLESQLRSLRVLSYERKPEGKFDAIVREDWVVTEYSLKNGQALGRDKSVKQSIHYILVPSGSRSLKVDFADVEPSAKK